MKHVLHVFPDSGHQTVFFPIAESVFGKAKDAPQFPANEDWSSPERKPWLKGRLGTRMGLNAKGQPAEQRGFWLAIDFNVGGADRGYWVPELANRSPRRRAPGVINDLEEADKAKIVVSRSPYIATDERDLPEVMLIDVAREFALDKAFGTMQLEVNFVEEAGDAIPVNLIVDFGNSRTVVLGLEQTETANGLSSVCKPIRFPKPELEITGAESAEDACADAIPESWFVLMESMFTSQPVHAMSAAFKPTFEDRTVLDRVLNRGVSTRDSTVEVAPHQFARVSPAVIGKAAREALSDVDTDAGGISFLSSPKRYIWDDQPLGAKGHTHWTMLRQPWRQDVGDQHDLVPLKGDIFRFMPNAGADWSLKEWSKFVAGKAESRPDHSRADSLIWVALAILEQADRQIQSEAWRQGNNPYLRRRLGDILLTHPAGWTDDEVERYRAKWERARDIFVLSRQQLRAGPVQVPPFPQIRMPLDEAVASQLAIIYAEMRHMRDYGENWIELYGRGEGQDARIRAMTIDIGGGTTDTSIVEYQDALPGAGIDLTSRLIFKDSTTHAGDRLMKDVIERVFLPRLGEPFAADQARKEMFEEVFFKRASRDSERAQWSVITRTVFVPIVQQWLSDFTLSEPVKPGTPVQSVSARAAGASASQIERMNALVRAAGLDADVLDPDQALAFSGELMQTVIADWFVHAARMHGNFAALFDCDLVILTGKPSELPVVRTLLERHLPLEADRIISAKDYFAGDWLPMSRAGNIDDAKLVTALGSAVSNAIETGLLPGWNITTEVDPDCRRENHWGRIAGSLKPFGETDILLRAGKMEGTARLLTESVIGRARFLNHVLPEQVYRFEHVSGEQMLVDAKFRRVMSKPGQERNSMTAESLMLISAKDANTGKKIPLSDIRLKLCTLPKSEDYWQDTGRFEVRWSA